MASHLTDFTASPPLPADFATLCEIVEQVEGVRFRDLFERLPKDQADRGDAALQQVLALARQVQTRVKLAVPDCGSILLTEHWQRVRSLPGANCRPVRVVGAILSASRAPSTRRPSDADFLRAVRDFQSPDGIHKFQHPRIFWISDLNADPATRI